MKNPLSNDDINQVIKLSNETADTLKAKSDDTGDFKNSFVERANSYSKLADAMNKLLAGDKTAAANLIQQYQSGVSKANIEWESAIKNLSSSEDKFVDAVNDLGQYLTDQYNKHK